MNNSILDKIKEGLIVSCQALEHEPLHSSFIMGKMALAAKEGGAIGIRANTKEDIEEIKKNVNLPVIGIVKRDYDDSDIYITPTIKEIDELMSVKCDIIAIDATLRDRPNKKSLEDFFKDIKRKYPEVLLMADCSTLEECINADKLGFDLIGTTLVGYTNQSSNLKIDADDFKLLKDVISNVKAPVVAEGNIDTPDKAKRVLELGAFTVVVGSIITRPQIITKKFTDKMKEVK